MQAAAEPVSLKGTREALLLLATGAFLAAFPFPIIGMLSGAGLALGAKDLRALPAGRVARDWLTLTMLAGWFTCVLNLLCLLGEAGAMLYMLSSAGALFCAATALSVLARQTDHVTHGIFLALVRIPLLAFLPLLLVSYPRTGLLIQVASCLAFAVLVLELRAQAVPYGHRRRAS